MVRKTGEERRIKYDIKRKTSMPVAYEKMVKDREPDLEAMVKRAEIDSKVAGILTAHDITGSDRIKYHNFAREVDKAIREGTLTETKLASLFAKYTALGCDDAILDEIVKALQGTSPPPS